MKHAYESDADPIDAPPIEESNDPGFPTDGDPANDVPETVIGTYWPHAVASEIIAVIEDGGLTPGDDLGQLAEAIPDLIETEFNALGIPVGFDFASRNEHIQANPPGNEAANPRDSRFAIRTYEDAVTPDFATRNEHTQANPPGDEFANPLDARFAINAYLEARA